MPDSPMPDVPQSAFLGRLRFPADLERAFQIDCYEAYRQPLRYVCALVALIYLSLFLRNYTFGTNTHFLAVDALPCLAFLIIFGLSFVRGFGAYWQPGFVLFTGAIIPFLMREHADGIRDAQTLPTLTAKLDDFFLSSIFTLMLVVSIVRLQFLWAALVQLLFFGTCIQAATTLLNTPLPVVWGTAQFLLVIQVVLTMNVVIQERLQREAFLANHLLAQDRADERRKRERTEAMLGVLGRAIGGIVHDLGNPLTCVRTGAETLRTVIEEEEKDRAGLGVKELQGEMLDIITDGAQMLDYLRLSLLEQTRVLEGKSIPIERSRVSVREMVQAGAHYQAPRFSRSRRVEIVGDDLEACVDGKRLITVYMNLIGNALKYTDGEIAVTWRTDGGVLLSAVLDQGMSLRGITQSEAEQLFVAFGRLASHAGVEGTGLGLLSAQKIVEAHGGEIFVEGYTDGSPSSACFTTAQSAYPSLLQGDFRTAFVIACPLNHPFPSGSFGAGPLPACPAAEGFGLSPPQPG